MQLLQSGGFTQTLPTFYNLLSAPKPPTAKDNFIGNFGVCHGAGLAAGTTRKFYHGMASTIRIHDPQPATGHLLCRVSPY